MKDPIKFDFLGMHLQEPMAFIMNLVIAVFCLYAFSSLKKNDSDPATKSWKLFYLIFGISTVFGAFGHLLFQYSGIPGKFPCWILGCIANVYSGRGMLMFSGYSKLSKTTHILIWTKSLALLIVAMVSLKFIFVAMDAILTYIIFTGIFGAVLIKRGLKEMWYMVVGTIVLLPSLFIFIFRWSPHRWFNSHDVSHVLMLSCIALYYAGMVKWNQKTMSVQHG